MTGTTVTEPLAKVTYTKLGVADIGKTELVDHMGVNIMY